MKETADLLAEIYLANQKKGLKEEEISNQYHVDLQFVLDSLEESNRIIKYYDSFYRGRKHNFYAEMNRDILSSMFHASLLLSGSASGNLTFLPETGLSIEGLDSRWASCETIVLAKLIEKDGLGNYSKLLLEPLYTSFQPHNGFVIAERELRQFNGLQYVNKSYEHLDEGMEYCRKLLQIGHTPMIKSSLFDWNKNEESYHLAIVEDVCLEKRYIEIYDIYPYYFPELKPHDNLYRIPFSYLEEKNFGCRRWMFGIKEMDLSYLFCDPQQQMPWEERLLEIIIKSLINMNSDKPNEGLNALAFLKTFISEELFEGSNFVQWLNWLAHLIRMRPLENRYLWYKYCKDDHLLNEWAEIFKKSYEKWTQLSNALLLIAVRKKMDNSLYNIMNEINEIDHCIVKEFYDYTVYRA
ncbi:hypothetical protein D3C74_148880 [compost metagenome]